MHNPTQSWRCDKLVLHELQRSSQPPPCHDGDFVHGSLSGKLSGKKTQRVYSSGNMPIPDFLLLSRLKIMSLDLPAVTEFNTGTYGSTIALMANHDPAVFGGPHAQEEFDTCLM